MNKRILAIIGYLVAAALFVVSFVYFTTPANHLPALLPGYDLSSAKAHTKHGIAALLLAFGALAFAWFQGGPSSAQEEHRGADADN